MYKRITSILLLSFFVTSVMAQVLGTDLFKGESKMKVRFSYNQKFILVDFQFDILPLTFILDTGAEHLILFKKEYSDILGLEYDKRINLMGADLDKEVFALISRNVPIKLANSLRIERDVIILEEDFLHLDKLTGESIDGIIGGRLLRGLVLELNYKKNKFYLHDHETFKEPKGFKKYDIDIDNHKPYISSHLTLKNGEKIPTKILIDTGAALPLLLFLKTHPSLTLPENVIKGNLGKGLGGNLVGFLSLSEQFEMTEDFKFQNLLTSYQDLENSELQNVKIERNGLIGNPLLERFHIYIDYVSQKIYLKPHKKRYNKSFKYDKSGLILYAFGAQLDNYYVKQVIEGSPAEKAGILAGDKLLRVGWLPTKAMSMVKIYSKFQKKAGKKVKVAIERKGKILKKTIILEDLFKK